MAIAIFIILGVIVLIIIANHLSMAVGETGKAAINDCRKFEEMVCVDIRQKFSDIELCSKDLEEKKFLFLVGALVFYCKINGVRNEKTKPVIGQYFDCNTWRTALLIRATNDHFCREAAIMTAGASAATAFASGDWKACRELSKLMGR